MPLYTSLAPDNKYDTVFEQTVAPGKMRIALRPLSLPDDWPFVSKWLQRTFGRRSASITHLPDKYLRETYAIMLQCDFAQPFIGLINEQPAFLVEICDGDKQCDAVEGGAHLFEPGDHAMRLILSQTVIHTRFWSENALICSLVYFFTHQQVKRVVWQLYEKDKFYLNLAKNTGIRERKFKRKDFDSAQSFDGPFDSAQDRNAGSYDSPQDADPEQRIQVYLYLRQNFTHFLSAYQRTIQKLL